MTIEITFLDDPPVRRRCDAEILDHYFRVSRGQSSCIVVIGISGPARFGKTLSSNELIEAASALLRCRLDNGYCDPFSHPETDSMIDLTPAIMDHWIEHRSFPPWF
jgi:hypothetical protein